MSDLIKDDSRELAKWLHATGGDISILKPFERDIFLFDTYIAGTMHVEGIRDLEPYLRVGDKLSFIREADNHFDKSAIAVRNNDGVKIGYVPKKDNVVFSRLMDAGKLLFGKITSKEMKSDWLNVHLDIYMHE